MSDRDREIMNKFLAEIGESALGPYEPLNKACAIADGFANRLARAQVQRNSAPSTAREHLIGAFAAWPVLCRAMAEAEVAFSEMAGQGAARARPMLNALDRRDKTGDYA